MSLLNMREKMAPGKFLRTNLVYVLSFSNRTLNDFVHAAVSIEIQAGSYTTHEASKVKKLREFWNAESDHPFGSVLNALIEENVQVCSRAPALTDHREATAKIDYLDANIDMKPYPNFRGSIGTEQVSKR